MKNRSGKNLAEGRYCSFIVKLWVEETTNGTEHGVWRGHITHVPSGNRKYVKDLDSITRFIAPYIEEMGVRADSRLAPGRWLRFLKW